MSNNGKIRFLVWDDSGEHHSKREPKMVLAYFSDDAAEEYTKRLYNESAGEMGEASGLNVSVRIPDGTVKRFRVYWEPDVVFHTRELTGG
jgi:hypothetical protein